MILDYSTARPSAQQLRAAGISAVGRYLGWDSEPGFPSIGKNLSAAEAHELITGGVAIFLAFEYAPDAALKGAVQGRADGQLAIRQLTALGAPPGVTVYFAVDFDLPDFAPHLPGTPANAAAKLGPAGEYFRAISVLAGRSFRIGVYGGYYAVSRVLDAGLADAGWQTVAWSGGQRDTRAVLYQTTAKAPIPGADVNVHEGTAADFGQWPRPAAPPAPLPQPAPQPQLLEDDMTLVLDLPVGGPATVLPVPAGAKTLTLYADDGYKGEGVPQIRVVFAGAGHGVQDAAPSWAAPAVLQVPSGSGSVSLARQGTTATPVTAAWS